MGLIWSVGIFSESKSFDFSCSFDNLVKVFNSKTLRNNRRHIHTYADPFLFCQDGKLYLFAEIQEVGGRGFINCWCTEDLIRWADLGPVLKDCFHVSYPNIFQREEGEIYLIPESSQIRKLCLYPFVEFPSKLAAEPITVLDGNFADSNLIEIDGIFFLSTLNQDSDLHEIYFSDCLFGGWQKHPTASISIRKELARNGGGFFFFNNRLFRAAQKREKKYGDALALCEVVEIGRKKYIEQVVIDNVGPISNFGWQSLGRHHLSVVEFGGHTILATDGLQKDYVINKALNLFYRLINI